MSDYRKIVHALIAAGVVCVGVPLFTIAPGKATKRQKAPFMGRNIAHRGLHSRDKSIPENSTEAFQQAVDAGYGVELDVQLSKDGHVVVFHDDTLDRVCGVHARVNEKNYSELRAMSLCGSKYGIPLFTDVLDIIGGKEPIICELKTAGAKNKELCEKTNEILSSYKGDVCIESFDPRIVAWFRRNAPDLMRGQLAGPTKSYMGEQSLPLAFLLSHLAFNFAGRPQFVAYKLGYQTWGAKLAYALGAMKICWTSHEPRNERGKDTVIFEFYKPRKYFK